MGLFDQLSGSLKGAIASELANNAPAFINAALAKTNMGDLKGLVAELQQGGLDEQVRSWLGNGQNLQIAPEQVESALGNEKLQQLAAQFGIPLETVSRLLAEHLPKAVDQASPGGVIQNS